MIEDIDLIGLDSIFVDKMMDVLGYDIVLNMACNYGKIRRNIAVFKELGVNNINDLILYRNDIFFLEDNELLRLFSNFAIREMVDLINEDYANVDLLFE